MARRGLSKEYWAAIRVHLPQPKASPRGGRPRVDDRPHARQKDVLLEVGPLEAHHCRARSLVSLNYSAGDHTSAGLQMKK
jgi:transposase